MINEVEAAIHHSYRFRPVGRGGTALSGSQFAHKSVKLNLTIHLISLCRYFCHYLGFCSVLLLIKTQGLIHVSVKLDWSDHQWYQLIHSHNDVRQSNEQDH